MSRKDFAKEILTYYLQSFGDLEKKIEILNRIAQRYGLEVEYVQDERGSGWIGTDMEQAELATEIRYAIDACHPLGEYEREARAIETILSKYDAKLGVKA